MHVSLFSDHCCWPASWVPRLPFIGSHIICDAPHFACRLHTKERANRLLIGSLVGVELVLPVTRSQEVITHETSYSAAQPLSAGEVKAEVNPSENSAHRRLFRSSRESFE